MRGVTAYIVASAQKKEPILFEIGSKITIVHIKQLWL